MDVTTTHGGLALLLFGALVLPAMPVVLSRSLRRRVQQEREREAE